MTFNQVVWKMAKADYKKYIFYFLCNSFAVMFFFMFSTVYFNSRIEQAKKLEGIQDALSIPGAALIIFTIFFISYAHNVFMKKRRSEFGLFLSLGMSPRDISKLLVIENGIIGMASILSGLLAGAVFSRLSFMLLMSSINLQDIPFHLSGKMFLYSIGAFLAVFLLAVGKSLIFTLRSSMILVMKSNRFAETIKMRSPLLGAFGLLLMVGSILTLYFTYEESSGAFLPLWTMAMFLGLYIAFSQASSFLIRLAKKFPGYYFHRLLFLSSLEYKFKQMTSIIMLVAVMIMITIFYSTLLLTFYKASEKDAVKNNPFDVAYYQIETKNNLSEAELNKILQTKDQLEIPIFYYLEKQILAGNGYHSYNFMSLRNFNELTKQEKSLENQEFLFFLNSEPEYAHTEFSETFRISMGNDEVTFEMKDYVVERRINLLPNSYEFVVVNDEVFDKMTNSLDGHVLTLNLLNVEDWKNSEGAVGELVKKFEAMNQAAPPANFSDLPYIEEELFRVASKVADFHLNKTTSGIMFYVTTFLSILFFMGTFILLYLNLFSEVDTEKAKYKNLYKIGMTSKEVKKNVTREIMTIFFVPTVIGTLLAFIYLVILSTDVGGIMNNPDILMHFLLIAGIYLAIQLGSYFYARKKMLIQLLG
ncbi:FtsX-like permease family protein [Mesobacillus subterraneus]|uniref:ABC transporter permease n=1 Tax=Mesobacillus subterraneus TaxID=285983 RepID=A0A3R9FL81_9BACI|nr:ABC transporter permease [Mesobacillus subterraneus]RSD29008.1 ABC transporter permease [Mesobacillus subterraneus]